MKFNSIVISLLLASPPCLVLAREEDDIAMVSTSSNLSETVSSWCDATSSATLYDIFFFLEGEAAEAEEGKSNEDKLFVFVAKEGKKNEGELVVFWKEGEKNEEWEEQQCTKPSPERFSIGIPIAGSLHIAIIGSVHIQSSIWSSIFQSVV